MSGVIGATHFVLNAPTAQGAPATLKIDFGKIDPTLWILATCQLTDVASFPEGNAQCGAAFAIMSFVDASGSTVNGPASEVHGQGISELNVQLSALKGTAQGLVTVFFGIEGTPTGVTPTTS
jgi:hypothetical protein